MELQGKESKKGQSIQQICLERTYRLNKGNQISSQYFFHLIFCLSHVMTIAKRSNKIKNVSSVK